MKKNHLLLPLITASFLMNCGGGKKFYKANFSLPDGATMYENDSQTIKKGGLVVKPKKDPYRPGYEFTGWYKDEKCSTCFDFETYHIKNMTTIYSGWKEDAKFAIPLCFTSNVDDNTLIEGEGFYYKTNLSDTWELGDGEKTLTFNENQKIYVAGNNTYSPLEYNKFTLPTYSFNVSGNIMSLINQDNFSFLYEIKKEEQFRLLFGTFEDRISNLVDASDLLLPATILKSACYDTMFDGCELLESAPTLPAYTLASSCYRFMFQESSIAYSPELPATTLEDNCYYGMFHRSKLKIAPELPATKLAYSCYNLMFSQTLITSAPELPATTLENYCYTHMFEKCRALTSAPALPATTLGSYCYDTMFSECEKMTSAPTILPATTLRLSCYRHMFSNCISLTSAPSLPATTLADSCYLGMFSNCISLISVPSILPATTLANFCYSGMFLGCSLLNNAPSLPATNLATECYYQMFYECTSLVSFPFSLPATTLTVKCYSQMFYGCLSLTNAPSLPATNLTLECYYQMFYDCTLLKVIENGTGTKIFTCPKTIESLHSVDDMFFGTYGETKGETPGTPTTDNIYYWYY